MAKETKPKVYIWKRADNGKITTEKYAKAHPDTTFREKTVRNAKPKKK